MIDICKLYGGNGIIKSFTTSVVTAINVVPVAFSTNLLLKACNQ